MRTSTIQTIIQKDGELHLSDLPLKKTDVVEVTLLVRNQATEDERQEAIRRFREHADRFSFRSERPYPSRDELHERH
jgi:hypothetical protein